MSHGCILEEDVTNIHEFAMDNWDERWIEGQGFSLFTVWSCLDFMVWVRSEPVDLTRKLK
jgi:hypothetical protein